MKEVVLGWQGKIFCLLQFLNQIQYYYLLSGMKGTRNTDNKQEKKISYPRQTQTNEARRAILQKMQARRLKNQQLESQVLTSSTGTNPSEKITNLPSSTRSEQDKSSRKYFRKEIIDPKNNKLSTSQDSKLRLAHTEQQSKNEMGFEKANSQYLKLHDKLNFLEFKISEMKKNLQKKKQEKLKKKKQQEQRKTKQQDETKPHKKKPSITLDDLVTKVPQKRQLHTFDKNPYSPRHNIYYVSQIVRAYKDPKSLAREHIHTSLQIMAYFEKCEKPSDEKIAPKKVKLARRKGYQDKKTVVFDLDETLIHCNENLEAPYDVKLPITFPNGEVIEAGINIRPHAKQILRNLSKNFEVIVFTASHSCYANVVLDYLDPEKQSIHHRLFRQHCYATPEGMHVKDLRVIDRQLSNMVLVDNAAYSYIYQLDNGIPILPYYHGNTDFQLKALQNYIQSMFLLKDVRTANRRTFKLHLYKNYYYDLEKLVEELYLTQHNC